MMLFPNISEDYANVSNSVSNAKKVIQNPT